MHRSLILVNISQIFSSLLFIMACPLEIQPFFFKQTISLKLDPRFFVSGVTEVEGDIN